MFDFQKEVIINSNLLDDGVNPRFMVMDGPVKLFRVLRCADYRKEGLVEGVIYKTPAEKGQVASAAFNLPTKEGTYRVVIGITLIGKYLADYAMPWSNFGKAVLAEFEVSAEDLGKTKELQEKMIKAIEMAIPENYRYVRVSAEDSDKVLVSCTDSHQVITVAELQEQRGISCPDSCTEKQYVTVDEAVEVTKNKMEIGTAAWLQENLRFPSYPNIRYAALNEEEYPVNGGLYTQFSFLYCMPRKGLHGQGTVGQALKSVTTHTFYVLSSLVDKFEEDLKKVFGDDSIKVISPDNTELINIEFVSALKVSVQDINEGKAIIKANVSGPAVSPNLIKYSIKEEDSKYQIDNDGKLTVKKGQTAAEGDKFTVKASYGNAVAEQEFTVGA
jgi:hypothetical protein